MAGGDVSGLPSTIARVFWLGLPPLKPAARLNAARLALRGRVATNANTMIALGNAAHPNGQWCAVVWDADALANTEKGKKPAAQNSSFFAQIAKIPWSPHSVSWWRDRDDPCCITAQGSSVSLEPSDTAALPDTVVQACGAAGVTSLNIYGEVSDLEKSQWAAQLGVPVYAHSANNLASANAAFLPTLSNGQRLVVAEHARTAAVAPATTGLAPWVACVAGLCYAAFGAHHWWSAKQALNATRDTERNAMASVQQSETTWAAWIKKNHPAHARESASSLLEMSVPALAPTAAKIKTLGYEARAINIEWSALSEAERDAFTQTLAARGLGVVSAGNKARVVWP
jgi:hypothetical protein